MARSQNGTLYLVDPDPAVRQQLAKIAERLELALDYHTSPETIPVAVAETPHACIVSEFCFEHGDALAMQLRLLEAAAHVPVIYLIEKPNTARTVRAIRRGAIDVLDKPCDDATLAKSIRSALRQRQRRVRYDAAHARQIRSLTMLSTSEQDVLGMIMQGKPNKVIARQLGVSMRTVELRRQRIFQKTNTRSLVQLLLFVLKDDV